MYLQMKLRHYDCVGCGTPCKSTSPNAVRCPKCAKVWEKERNRQNQRRRYQRLMAVGIPVKLNAHSGRNPNGIALSRCAAIR